MWNHRVLIRSHSHPRDLRLPKYQDSGRLLGYGHVTFSSEEERDAVSVREYS